jgi:CubicO group peptidase (beta-lactamase class C family)
MRKTTLVLATLVLIFMAQARAQETWPTRKWPTGRPQTLGLDSAKLAAFAAEIGSGKYGFVDGMLVIRHGKVAYERSYKHNYDSIYGSDAKKPSPLNAHEPTGPYNYFNPWWHPYYRRGDLHTLQSVTKTISSVIIGAAIGRGDFPSIDTPILTFFDSTKVKNIDYRKRRVTIRHLLTMTAGLDWNESLPYTDPNNAASQMEASADWVQFTIDRPMAEEPGTRFNYSSGESELLSHIFYVATGRDIEEYAARNVFAPLGITDWFWKRSPTGLADTEGGLYLRRTDLARIWYLYLKNGSWEGKQIVSAEWARASVTPAVDVAGRGVGVKYGLKWWLVPYGEGNSKLAWAGSGFGGQVPIAFPEYDMIVVFNAWNILPGKPALGRQVIMDRVLGALTRLNARVR